MKTPRKRIKAAFEGYMSKAFPSVPKKSKRYIDLYETYMSGALFGCLLTVRYETAEGADACADGILEIISDLQARDMASRQ